MKTKKLLLLLPTILLASCTQTTVPSESSSLIQSESSKSSSHSSEQKPNSSSETTTVSKPTLYAVGDSTLASFNDSYYFPRYGYATQLSTYFTENLNIVNLALSGRSSKSFLTEENYQTLKDSLKEGDYLLIGFGHNDEKFDDQSRYTDPVGDINTDGSFKKTLFDNYIKLALDKKATPILATPIVRYDSTFSYTGEKVHITSKGDYAKAIRELADSQNVNYIDLTELTKTEWLSKQEEAKKYHAMIDKVTLDGTHLNKYGAQMVSYLLANNVKESENNPLKAYLKPNFEKPLEATYYIPNPDYKEAEYTTPTSKGSMFYSEDEYWGTCFGNVGSNSKPAGMDIIKNSDGSITMKSTGKGKVASDGDGFLMLAKKISSTEDFEFSTDITINSFSGKQTAFGIMVRDDYYIDAPGKTPNKSSYIAAGTLVNSDLSTTYTFSRINGALTDKKNTEAPLEAGSTHKLKIKRADNSVTITFDDYTFTNNDLDLTSVDKANDYVGFFLTRTADVTFSNYIYTKTN